MLNLKKSQTCSSIFLSICILWLMGQGTVAAAEPDPVALQLLVDMWAKNTENREGSVRLYEQQVQKSEQVLMAYTLNRMKHNRYRDALVPANQLTTEFPKNLDGWILRIWLDTVTRNYNESLIGIRLMKRQIDQQPDLTDSKKEKYYDRLARIIGYLQGPVTSRTDQATLNSTITKLVEGMTPEQLQSFNDKRTAVLDSYEQKVNDASGLVKQEKDNAAAEAAIKTKTIQTQNQTLTTRLQQIQPEKDRLQIEGEQKASAIESQLAPLRQELAAHVHAARAAEANLHYAYGDLSLEHALLARQEPGLGALNYHRIYGINSAINGYQSDLYAANARISNARGQVHRLGSELEQVNRTYQNQIEQLSAEQHRISREQRHNASELIKVAKGANAPTPKIRGVETKIESLRTYDPFPLELERHDYLDAIKAKD